MKYLTNNALRAALLAGVIALGLITPHRAHAAATEEILLAGGCFWCVEADMEALEGVGDVVSGFTGGREKNPDYEDVARGRTGHFEAVRVPFDPAVISLPDLLDAYFRRIDPTDAGGQFCDRGRAYRTAIFAAPSQLAEAQAALERAETALGGSLATEVLPAGAFWPAEEKHQNFYKSNKRMALTSVGLGVRRSVAYTRYRAGCGRDARVKQVWGAEAFGR